MLTHRNHDVKVMFYKKQVYIILSIDNEPPTIPTFQPHREFRRGTL